MKFVYPEEGNMRREAATVGRTWWPLSQRARDVLTIAVAVATVVGVLWGIGASVISGLENRLIDRIDRLERDMAEGFKQSHQRMDRMDGRMDRIESDVDAIEKHLLRIGSAIDSEGFPATNVPAVAKPARHVISTGPFLSDDPPAIPPTGER